MFAQPAYSAGMLQFTEAMYDAPGADTGREWLEITNLGQDSADLAGYKLFESGVNHMLTAVQGSGLLAAGESAVIASNPQKFLTDYPSYTGTLLKSSFSLTNTGEELELRGKTLEAVASISYSSAQGAAGDGNSLHVSGTALVPGAPNPGSNAPTKPIVKAAPSKADKAVKTSTSAPAKKSGVPNSIAVVGDFKEESAAAVGMAPLLHTIPSLYFYVLGLLAVIALGVGAVLYAKPETAAAETGSGSEEFEIEG